ncbi:putative acetyltransferase [Vibrio coralliirubri]|uniref:Acetyltransferase n=1 Tax=Vibrio coralliirubri TaxID=1516159 RepID=A0AA87C2B8_9VIBR|nr:acyltransferase [Vibrio coralliirubri]CDU10778.1 putative acetyltransferase [Vibrio coralliirubri]
MLNRIINILTRKNRLRSSSKLNEIKKGSSYFSERIELGEYIYVGPGYFINAKGGLEIGDGTIVGPNVTIWTVNHNYNSNTHIPYDNIDYLEKVSIGKGVWIGEGVKILPGVKIGDGAVIAMGSVVFSNVSENTLVVGNPAKEVKLLHKKRIELISQNQFYLKSGVRNKTDVKVKNKGGY